MTPLLSVNNLAVKFNSDGSKVIAVDGINFEINKGEVLALVGESGSGKSVSALSTLSLLPNNADVSGSVKLQGKELVGISHKELKSVRGSEVSFIFQEPMTSLNPLHTIEKQLREAVELHTAAHFSNITEYIIENNQAHYANFEIAKIYLPAASGILSSLARRGGYVE